MSLLMEVYWCWSSRSEGCATLCHRWWRSCKDNPLSFLRGHYYKVTGITMEGYAGGETEGGYQLVPKGKVDYRRTYSVT